MAVPRSALVFFGGNGHSTVTSSRQISPSQAQSSAGCTAAMGAACSGNKDEEIIAAKEQRIAELMRSEADLKAKFDKTNAQLTAVDTKLKNAIMPRTLKEMEELEGRLKAVPSPPARVGLASHVPPPARIRISTRALARRMRRHGTKGRISS